MFVACFDFHSSVTIFSVFWTNPHPLTNCWPFQDEEIQFSACLKDMTSKFAVISTVTLLCLNLGMQILECLIWPETRLKTQASSVIFSVYCLLS